MSESWRVLKLLQIQFKSLFLPRTCPPLWNFRCSHGALMERYPTIKESLQHKAESSAFARSQCENTEIRPPQLGQLHIKCLQTGCPANLFWGQRGQLWVITTPTFQTLKPEKTALHTTNWLDGCPRSVLGSALGLDLREGGRDSERVRGRDSGVVFLLNQTDRKWIGRREETPFWAAGSQVALLRD